MENFGLEYWHWLVFGMTLMATELFMGAFIIFWPGLAAASVGGLLLLAPSISLKGQILAWTILTIIYAVAWFKWIKPLSVDKTKAGLSMEMFIGEVGMVTRAPNEQNTRGELRFPAPIHGSDTWAFLVQGEAQVQPGDRVRIVNIAGNTLVVVPNNQP